MNVRKIIWRWWASYWWWWLPLTLLSSRRRSLAQGEEEAEAGGQIGTPMPGTNAPTGPTRSGVCDARSTRKHVRWRGVSYWCNLRSTQVDSFHLVGGGRYHKLKNGKDASEVTEGEGEWETAVQQLLKSYDLPGLAFAWKRSTQVDSFPLVEITIKNYNGCTTGN